MKKSNISRLILYAIYILSPVFLLLCLSFIFKCNTFMGKPLWSDEIIYWREIYSFVNKGFNMGYTGVDELIPKCAQFSTHGFFVAIFYYPFAKILGCPTNIILISNLIFTVICFLIVVFILRPSIFQTVCFILLYLLFAPIVIYAPTSMTEMLNYGLLALFFTFFYRYINAEVKSRKYLLLTILVGTLCSFYRIIYIVLFVMPIILLSRFRFNKRFIKLSLIWLVYSGIIYYINSLFTAPYRFGILYQFTSASSISEAIDLIIYNFTCNIQNILDPTYGDRIEVFLRLLYIIIMIIYLVLIFAKQSSTKGNHYFYLIQFIILCLPLLIVLTIYDVIGYRDFRSLAPFLWASFFNIILYKRFTILKILAPLFIMCFVLSMINLPSGFCLYENKRYNYSSKGDFTFINSVVKFNEDYKDPFENTILTDTAFNPELLENLNPGIGIEWFTDSNEADNYKSKYVLINTNKDIPGYKKEGLTEFGWLYTKKE